MKMNSNFNRIIEYVSKELKKGKFIVSENKFSHSKHMSQHSFETVNQLSKNLVLWFYLDLGVIEGEDEFDWMD